MSQFIESICFEHQKIRNLSLHQRRFDQTRKNNFGDLPKIDLSETIKVPLNLTNEKYKIRIIYDKEIQSIEFHQYKIKRINTIKLQDIDCEINYNYKYLNRYFFDETLKNAEADDLILVKSDYITDCIYSNIVFFDGNSWITPSTYLLKGTMREALLQSGRIIQREIKVSDLKKFKSFKRINAMMNLEESQEIEICSLQNL